MSLSLDPDGDKFTLTRTDDSGSVGTFTLSGSDVLQLAQSAQRLTDQIVARHNRPEAGVSFSVATPIARVRLNVDLHASEILLGMIDGQGAETTFCLGLDVAKPLAERLPVRIAEIEQPEQTRQ